MDNRELEQKVEEQFDHAIHPNHAPKGPQPTPPAPGKRPHGPVTGLREDDES